MITLSTRSLAAFALLHLPALSAPRIADRNGVRSLATIDDRSVLAQGAVFEVNGEELGPAGGVEAEIPYSGSLQGSSVSLTPVAGGSAVRAFLISASARRIVAVLPSTAASGDYRVTVSSQSGDSAAGVPVKVAVRAFGLITASGIAGSAAGGRIVSPDGGEPAALSMANAAGPGATLELDATGLGPIPGPDNEPPGEENAAPDAVLLIGGIEVPVSYLGRNPGKPGYDRVSIQLPAEGLPSGCAVLAQIRTGDYRTPVCSIPLRAADEAACTHPLGVSSEGLAALARGGSIVRGTFTLVRLVGQSRAANMTFESRVDQFSGAFASFTAEEIETMTARSLLAAKPDANGCTLFDSAAGEPQGMFVDAGPSLVLTGPAWNRTIPRGIGQAMNVYGQVLDSKLNGNPTPGPPTPGLLFGPGPYTLTGPGGAVVGPFQFQVNVSPVFQWTNMDATTEVDTSRDLVFRYSGGMPDDTVAATQTVRGPAPEEPSRIVSRSWICLGKAGAGSLTVSSSLLQKMPRVSAAELAAPSSGRTSSLTLGMYNPDGVGLFRAPLTAGGQTELIPFLYNYTWSKVPVPVR